jgi:branched-chain amino acid transport system ATP-binding protein
MTALSIRALSKAFGGVHAVRDVSFDIKPGEFLAMIGPNGANKKRRSSSTPITANINVSK